MQEDSGTCTPGELRDGRTWLLRTLVAALALSLSACGLTDPEETFSYELRRVNGRPLPTSLWQDGATADGEPIEFGPVVVSGQIVFRADGTCRRSLVVDVPGTDTRPPVRGYESWWTCTWERDDSGVIVEWTGSSSSPVPVHAPPAIGAFRDDGVLLRFDLQLRCFTFPCPGSWTEGYRRVGEA